ncbi:uncharacterized protein LOC121262408 [Juglans microcarpa x Juglans regia]|uniref:uncharacterized protein LOC121262408 n=1 Tax=Juglans microcarpa x Juglans regia TaxID=2249226 RepID=UPI001B7E937F|nr:uncharacterized protein LOC121262408 [Juglans microcarpa x Juglans regia]
MAGRSSFVRLMEMRFENEENLVDFVKKVKWSKKNDKFVTPMTEEKYNEMTAKMTELEPEKQTKEAATVIFKEVLGHRPAYVRGLSEMVILESSRQSTNARIAESTEFAERDEKEAAYYKALHDNLRANVMLVMEKQVKYDKFMERYELERQTLGESHRETWGPA